MSTKSVIPTHPSQSFRIPGKIRADFEIVETWLQNQADQHGLSISQLVEAMLEFSYQEVRADRVAFPQFSRCRHNHITAIAVPIPESERVGPPPTFPTPIPQPKAPPARTVNYRIAPDIADWVRRMAADYFAIGEMLLILLSHSMAAIQEERAQINVNFSVEIEPIVNTPTSNGSEQ